MTKIRVLLLTHTLSLSGAPKVALDALEQMGDAVEVRTVATEGGPLELRCQQLGALDYLSDPRYQRFPRRLRQPFGKRKLETGLRRWRPNVIYANSLFSLAIVQSLRLPTAPALLHVHELETAFDYFGAVNDPLIAEWPQHYLAVSSPVRDLLLRRRIEESKITLVHEFVRDQDFHALPPPVTKTDSRFVVGGAGTANWRKGKSQWLELATELRKLVGEDKIRFVWVGVKQDADGIDFKNEARLRGLEGIVEFVPVTSDPIKHFVNFDVFAMTSWDDPCPVVVLENMMLKKPVLCFAGSGGAPEQVGTTGVVVEEFSPLAMAHAAARLMSHPERMTDLGDCAQVRIGQQFLASQQGPKIFEVLQRLAAN